MDGNWKYTSTLPEILVLGPPQSPEFLVPQYPEFPHGSTLFLFTTPTDIWEKGEYETNINPQVYSFHVIFKTETMRLSFTLSFVFI